MRMFIKKKASITSLTLPVRIVIRRLRSKLCTTKTLDIFDIEATSVFRADRRESYLRYEEKWDELHPNYEKHNIIINGVSWNEKNLSLAHSGAGNFVIHLTM